MGRQVARGTWITVLLTYLALHTLGCDALPHPSTSSRHLNQQNTNRTSPSSPSPPSSSTSTGPGSKKLKLGFLLPITDPELLDLGRGFQLAGIAAMNATARIDFTTISSNCDPDLAAAGVKTLAARGVQVIIGELCSGATLAAVQAADAAGVVIISPASTSPRLTNSSRWFFRTCPEDNLQAEVLAGLMAADRVLRPMIVYSDEPYGAGVAASLSRVLGPGKLRMQPFQGLYRGPLQVLPGTDALLVATNDVDSAAAIVSEAAANSFIGHLYGTDSLPSSIAFLDRAGDAAEGLKAVIPTEGVAWFKEWFRSVWGYDSVVPYGAQAHDAVAAAIKGWQLSGYQKSPSRIRDAMNKVRFNGASGPVAFKDGDLLGGTYEVLAVKSNFFVKIGDISPQPLA